MICVAFLKVQYLHFYQQDMSSNFVYTVVTHINYAPIMNIFLRLLM